MGINACDKNVNVNYSALEKHVFTGFSDREIGGIRSPKTFPFGDGVDSEIEDSVLDVSEVKSAVRDDFPISQIGAPGFNCYFLSEVNK